MDASALYELSSRYLQDPGIREVYTKMWNRVTQQALQPSFETEEHKKEFEDSTTPDHS